MAAKSGDVARVINVLGKGADPNFHHPEFVS